MMQIKEISTSTGVPAKTIRYYEEIGLLPHPARQENGYRQYAESDVNRLKLVAGARRLDISLSEIKEILDMRDRKEAPCAMLLDVIQQKQHEIEARIRELEIMKSELSALHTLGQTFPTDDVEGKNCVCHLVSESVA